MADNLHQLYMLTRYEIFALRTFLTIGEKNAAVDAFLARHQIGRYAFLTAWNPQSQLLPERENLARNRDLAVDLAPWQYLIGTTRGPDDQWPGEESFFVLGIELEPALQLANKYAQNAIVCGAMHGPAELVFANDAARRRCQSPAQSNSSAR